MSNIKFNEFSPTQQNQLSQIKELGFDCIKLINTDIDVAQLREFRKIATQYSELSNSKKKLLMKFFFNNSFDITKYFKNGIMEEDVIKFLYIIEREGIDTTPFITLVKSLKNKKLEKLRLLYKFLQEESVDVSNYILKGYDESLITSLVKLDKSGLDTQYLNESGYTYEQMLHIADLLIICPEILDKISPSINCNQLKGFKYVLENGYSIDEIEPQKYSYSVTKAIVDARIAGYDIKQYADKENCDDKYLGAILRAMKHNVDPEIYKNIKDYHKYRPVFDMQRAKMDLSEININEYSSVQLETILSVFVMEKINYKKLLNSKFSPEQMLAIKYGLLNKLDTTILEEHIFDSRQIKEIRSNMANVNFIGLIDENTSPETIKAIASCINAGYKIQR